VAEKLLLCYQLQNEVKTVPFY